MIVTDTSVDIPLQSDAKENRDATTIMAVATLSPVPAVSSTSSEVVEALQILGANAMPTSEEGTIKEPVISSYHGKEMSKVNNHCKNEYFVSRPSQQLHRRKEDDSHLPPSSVRKNMQSIFQQLVKSPMSMCVERMLGAGMYVFAFESTAQTENCTIFHPCNIAVLNLPGMKMWIPDTLTFVIIFSPIPQPNISQIFPQKSPRRILRNPRKHPWWKVSKLMSSMFG